MTSLKPIRAIRNTIGLLVLALLALASAPPALAQTVAPLLGSNCTATLLNHSVQLDDNGTFAIPNIPYNPGQYRAKIICTNSDGTTSGAYTGFASITPNGDFSLDRVDLDSAVPPSATNLVITPATTTLGSKGATSQLFVSAFYADGTYLDVSADPGTTYTLSNPAIAAVSATGLVSAVSAGVVNITVRYDGLVGSTSLNVSANLDSDGDGMPDEWEIAHGLNPFDPSDAALDPDGDGLTNLQEYQLGTDPHVADTDGDGLSDGQEVKLGTNPLVADTDGDGLSDGQEVTLGTNPLSVDTDGDGISDGLEVKLGTNPLVADPTTTVTGRVIGPDGKPVPGASATVLLYFTGTTDLTGLFTIPFVPTDVPGAGTTLTASVIAALSGGSVENGSSNATTSVPSGTTDLGVIQLGVSTGVVTGTIVNPKLKPVPGAIVTISGTGVTLTATADATGTYRVTNLPGGAIMVGALDPTTGLRGQSTGTLPPQSTTPLTVNVTLGGFGTVAGTVANADGSPAATGTTVSLSGSTTASTTTAALGAYAFPFVPLGSFTVQATDTRGNSGSASGFIATTSQTVTANIQFLGNGTVTGLVSDASGNPAPNAAITLMAQNSTQQSLTTTSDASGHYTLSNVFVGSFAVSASLASGNLGGTALGIINQQGQTVTLNITLAAAGTITGRILQADGQTPAASVKVQAGQNAITATSDAQGNYTLNFVPPGKVQLLATDPATGNQGSVNTTSTASTTTTAPNLVLNGLGNVSVTVLDATGTPVPNAQLTLTSDTAFTQQLSGLSSATGTYTFQNVLAGGFTVMATNPVNELAGTSQGTLTVAGNATVTVNLQPAGVISGTVFAADGKTPAPGVEIQLDQSLTTVSASDGTYQFATVPAGTHSIVALDGVGTASSPSATATITTQGQTVTANLILISRGTVNGTVTNIDGTVAVGVAVSAQSLTAGFVRTVSTQTDVSGNYTITGVPTGPISVLAYTPTASAQVNATLPAATPTVTVNLMLAQNQVRTTQTLFDANAMPYDLDQTGEISSGLNSVFAGFGIAGYNQHDETLTLYLDSDGSTHGFSGNVFATSLQNGQELAVEQDGVAGLNVTRRIFVPKAGYMARYLEVLANPTAADITVDVNLTSGYRYTHENRDGYTYNGTPEVNGSSSGDSTFSVTTDPTTTDHWIIEGTDEDTDPFINSDNVPSVAYVFDDGKGPVSLGAGSFVTTSSYGKLSATWQKVRIPAGQTVELMHFVSQEVLRTAATASAQRLVQLPPEALLGLSAADASAIQNFAVPQNLTSTVAALPALTGQVGGTVYAGDTTTPIPAALVSLQSADPIFARTYQYKSDGSGNFQFNTNLDGAGDAIAIPLENFNLSAIHPITKVASPTFNGSLTTAVPGVLQPVNFSNTGQVQGTVRLNATTVVTNGTITFTSPSLTGTVAIPIQADGTYAINGLPAGTYAEVASITGTLLTGLATPLVSVGTTTTQDIMIGTSGAIQGTVRGSDTNHTPLPGITVYLHMGAQTVSTLSNSSGAYSFTDVPGGAYTLQAYDPASNTAATVSVTVSGSATTTQDIVLSSGGSVTVQATAPSGVVLSGLTTTLHVTTSSGVQTFTATTSSTGAATFNNIPVGQLSAEVDAANGYSGTTTGTLGLSGQTVTLNVTLVQSGTISGTILASDGKTPVPNAPVQLYGTLPNQLESLVATTQTDATGHYIFRSVPVGAFTVAAQNTPTGDQGYINGTIATTNQQLTVNVTLDGVGTINVTVVTANGNPDAAVNVTATSSFNTNVGYKGTTSAQGTVTLSNVLAGQVTVNATDPTTQLTGQSTVTLAPNGTQNVNITLQPSGKIAGHIYQADGTTPAAGAGLQIYLYGTSQPAARFTTLADGSYQFLNLPLGEYVINVYDPNQVLRNYAAALILATSGQVITQDISYLAIATVKGTVSNPDGTAAANLGVTLVSQGRLTSTLAGSTDASGNYSITGVPAGAFQVTAQDLSHGLGGTSLGSVTKDGDIVTVNIQLTSNVVSLGQTLTDFNGFPYDVQHDGSIGNGATYPNLVSNNFFNPTYQNAFHLSLFQNGAATDFIGASTAVTSIGGRQLAITQSNLDSLNVTRKIYVPSTGYFARYLEILSNPGTTPVTVDVQVSGQVQSSNGLNAISVTTSSGDASLSSADTTLVTNDDTGSSPYPYSEPALGEAFEGPGAPVAVTPSYQLPSGLSYAVLTYRWNSITIPAGGEVAFLHFATQQTNQGQAAASVARLYQLPPEGLTGLQSDELAAIQNFVIPQGGTSTLPAITVPSSGSVTGHVYAGDNQTLVPGALAVFTGTDLYLGATAFQLADRNGVFDLTSVPVASYTLQGTDPNTSVRSPIVNGTFAQGVSNSSNDIVFSNTGLITGTLNVPTGTAYSQASISLNSTNQTVGTINLTSANTFTFTGLLPGTYTLQLIAVPQYGNSSGSYFFVQQTVTITAGQATPVTVTLPAVGTVSGTFTDARGNPETHDIVQLTDTANTFSRLATTDSSGAFSLPQLPAGTYTLTGTDGTSGLTATATVTVTAGSTTTQNLQLATGATINLTVNYANGQPAPNTLVTIHRSMDAGNVYQAIGVTAADGTLPVTAVPIGAYQLVVYYPGETQYQGGAVSATSSGTVATNGEVIPMTIALPAVSTLTGTITTYSGTAAPSAVAILDYPGNGSAQVPTHSTTTATSSGTYTFPVVLASTSVQLGGQLNSGTYYQSQSTITTAASGQTLTQNIKLPVNTTVVVTVTDTNNNPVPQAYVTLDGTQPTTALYSYYSSLTTGNDGTVTFTNVPDASYSIQVSNSNGSFTGSGIIVVHTTDDGKTLPITVQNGYTGTISGTLLASDGATPAPPATYNVLLLDADTQDYIAQVTSTDGTFSFPNITVGHDGFTIQSQMTQSPTYTYGQPSPVNTTGNFTAQGQNLTANVTLPIPVLTGTIYQSDGSTPATNPNVQVTVPNEGTPVTFFGVSNAQGVYTAAVPAHDQASIIANANGLTTQAQYYIQTGDTIDHQDVILVPSGTVTGTVTDGQNPLFNVQVSVTSSGSTYTLFAQTDASGNYTLSGVATGTLTVVATYYQGCAATVTGTLANQGDTATINPVINTANCNTGPSSQLRPPSPSVPAVTFFADTRPADTRPAGTPPAGQPTLGCHSRRESAFSSAVACSEPLPILRSHPERSEGPPYPPLFSSLSPPATRSSATRPSTTAFGNPLP
ncbi:carboxypeptidase regulatory-like domain-containing protein [Granulicella sibirica]|uniref:Ig domain protein group 2 domain protein n=1 Tax=Granulicella sibirica TaxID=2479048 RepID=A0A4Q0T9X6_9BACT|nr:carboxypeptidase regulatory-like domain-containing protein [Granulicella sibirica]RXH58431.1 Ig domain protein group 2 domain protein [Granulicella sibirica]